MEFKLQFVRTILGFTCLTFLMDYVSGFRADTGIVHTKCGRVDTPFIIECNPGEIIYIRKTIITEFGVNSDSTCFQPDYNPYCHVFVNHTDIEFNGKQIAGFTFWKELLRNYDHVYGNCRQTSTSETVQITYQCFTVTSMQTICQNKNLETRGEGHIVSPNFPRPVNEQHESCSCEISTRYPDEVKLTVIMINPTATSMWSLRLTADDRGWSHDIARNVMYTTHLNHLSGQSVTLDYFSRRDTTYEPVYMPGKPAGFWMKVESMYGNSVLSLRCFSSKTSEQGVKGTLSSGAVFGIICCIVGVFFIFLMFVGYFVYYWRKQLYCKPKPTGSASNSSLSGHTNVALSIEESVNHEAPKSSKKLETMEKILKLDTDFEFIKTTVDGKMRYSTLPCRKKQPFDRTQRFMSCRIVKADVHKHDIPRMCPSGSVLSVSAETRTSKESIVPERDSGGYISFDLTDFDDPQLCSSRNISVVLPETCTTQENIIQEETAKQREDNTCSTFDMFDFDVLYLAGATDAEIDV